MSLPEEPRVRAVFESYPKPIRGKLVELRRLILETAAETDGVGTIEETLKWGEPAYLTTETRSGSTIRLGFIRKETKKYALYFNCQTDLVPTFRLQFKDLFEFDGNRAVILHADTPIPTEAVCACIRDALTYHLRKKGR